MKKILAGMLAIAIFVVSFAACSNNGSETKGETKTQESTGETKKEDITETEGNAVNWPGLTTQVFVGYKAGGMSDLHARIIAAFLQESLGKTFVVTNQDSSPVIAYDQVRTSSTDGSSLLSAHLGMLSSYYLGTYDYKLWEDFTIIAFMQNQGNNVFAVSADAKWDTLSDFVEDAKSRPGEILAGITAGSTSELMFGGLESEAGIELKKVDGGSDTEKIVSLQGGYLDIAVISASNAIQYEEAGELKVLAAITDMSDPRWPTTKEQGFSLTWDTGMFIVGPPDMAPALVETINAALGEVMNSENVVEQVENLGGTMEWMNVEDSQARMQKRAEEIKTLVEGLGLSVR